MIVVVEGLVALVVLMVGHFVVRIGNYVEGVLYYHICDMISDPYFDYNYYLSGCYSAFGFLSVACLRSRLCFLHQAGCRDYSLVLLLVQPAHYRNVKALFDNFRAF
jgi:hypothetical protein